MSPLDRLGGMLLCPRETLALVARGGAGGFPDAATFAVLEAMLLAGPDLARAALRAESLGAAAALGMAANAVLGRLLLPTLIALGIAIVLTIVSRGPRKEARDLDLASLCVVPLLASRAVDGILWSVSGLDLSMPLGLLGLGGTAPLAWLAVRERRTP